MTRPRTTLVIPSKRLFFQPLLPDFDHRFLLPLSFFKHTGCKNTGEVVLRSSAGKLWPIKLNDGRFEEGWSDFTRHHELQVGEFLVFRHEGDMLFHATVFDHTTCNREFPVFSIKDEPLPHPEPEPEPPANKSAPDGVRRQKQAYFDIQLPASSAKYSKLCIPVQFAEKHGLCGRNCKLIVKDAKGRSWPTLLRYRTSPSCRVFLGEGWVDCVSANRLKEGNSLRFKLIKKGDRPALKMIRLKQIPEQRNKQNSDDAEASSSSINPHYHNVNATSKSTYPRKSLLRIPKEKEVPKESFPNKPQKRKQAATASKTLPERAHPYFVVNVSSFKVGWYKVYIPKHFARQHNLDKKFCEVILIDQKGRSWPANLLYKKAQDQIFISSGWREFRLANDLMAGDSFVFELIGNGEKPVLRASALEEHPENTAAETGSSSTRHPYCFVTIKPSHVKSSLLRIPAEFAERHKLTRKCDDATLVDEKGNLWRVSTYTKNNNVYLGSGWSEFCRAHCVEGGDVLMIELIKEGKKPIMRISGVKRGTEEHRRYSMERAKRRGLEDVKPEN